MPIELSKPQVTYLQSNFRKMAGRADVRWRLWDVARDDMRRLDIEEVDLQSAFTSGEVVGCDMLGMAIAMTVVGENIDGLKFEIMCNSRYTPFPVIEVFTVRAIVKDN